MRFTRNYVPKLICRKVRKKVKIKKFQYIRDIGVIFFEALVAQLVAHQTSNLRVAGSIPV